MIGLILPLTNNILLLKKNDNINIDNGSTNVRSVMIVFKGKIYKMEIKEISFVIYTCVKFILREINN
jgi:hypothetical protein